MAIFRFPVSLLFSALLLAGCATAPTPTPIERNSVDESSWVVEAVRATERRFGFEPLESLEFGPDDLEIRAWNSAWGPRGYILRRQDGFWEAFQVEEPLGHWYALGIDAARVQPICLEDQILAALERERVFDLSPRPPPPDDPCPGGQEGDVCLDRIVVGGYSVMIETRRGREINRNVWDNPDIDPTPDTLRAREIMRILGGSLSDVARIDYEPHPVALSPDHVVLLRESDLWVEAFRVMELVDGGYKIGGRLRAEAIAFARRDPADPFEPDPRHYREIELAWTNQQPPLIDGRLRFAIDDGRWSAQLAMHPVAEVSARSIAVIESASLGSLGSLDSEAIERASYTATETPYGRRRCHRIERLEPVPDQSPSP